MMSYYGTTIESILARGVTRRQIEVMRPLFDYLIDGHEIFNFRLPNGEVYRVKFIAFHYPTRDDPEFEADFNIEKVLKKPLFKDPMLSVGLTFSVEKYSPRDFTFEVCD